MCLKCSVVNIVSYPSGSLLTHTYLDHLEDTDALDHATERFRDVHSIPIFISAKHIRLTFRSYPHTSGKLRTLPLSIFYRRYISTNLRVRLILVAIFSHEYSNVVIENNERSVSFCFREQHREPSSRFSILRTVWRQNYGEYFHCGCLTRHPPLRANATGS